MSEQDKPLRGGEWVFYEGERRWLRGVLPVDPPLGMLETPDSDTLGIFQQVPMELLTCWEDTPQALQRRGDLVLQAIKQIDWATGAAIALEIRAAMLGWKSDEEIAALGAAISSWRKEALRQRTRLALNEFLAALEEETP